MKTRKLLAIGTLVPFVAGLVVTGVFNHRDMAVVRQALGLGRLGVE